jgi:hypothetical protein
MAEDAARELPNLPLEDALQLVHLDVERESPKYAAVNRDHRLTRGSDDQGTTTGSGSSSSEVHGLSTTTIATLSTTSLRAALETAAGLSLA